MRELSARQRRLYERLEGSTQRIRDAELEQARLIHDARNEGLLWDEITAALGCTHAWARRLAKRVDAA